MMSKGETVIVMKKPAVNAAINYREIPSVIPLRFSIYLQESYTPILVALRILALKMLADSPL